MTHRTPDHPSSRDLPPGYTPPPIYRGTREARRAAMALVEQPSRAVPARRLAGVSVLLALSLAAAMTGQLRVDSGDDESTPATAETRPAAPTLQPPARPAEAEVEVPVSPEVEPSPATTGPTAFTPIGVPGWVWRGEAAPPNEPTVTSAGNVTLAPVPPTRVAATPPPPLADRPGVRPVSAQGLTPRRSAARPDEQAVRAGSRTLYVVPLTHTRGQVTESGILELTPAPRPLATPEPVVRRREAGTDEAPAKATSATPAKEVTPPGAQAPGTPLGLRTGEASRAVAGMQVTATPAPTPVKAGTPAPVKATTPAPVPTPAPVLTCAGVTWPAEGTALSTLQVNAAEAGVAFARLNASQGLGTLVVNSGRSWHTELRRHPVVAGKRAYSTWLAGGGLCVRSVRLNVTGIKAGADLSGLGLSGLE